MMRLIYCHEFTNADEYECIFIAKNRFSQIMRLVIATNLQMMTNMNEFTAKDTKGILKALW